MKKRTRNRKPIYTIFNQRTGCQKKKSLIGQPTMNIFQERYVDTERCINIKNKRSKIKADENTKAKKKKNSNLIIKRVRKAILTLVIMLLSFFVIPLRKRKNKKTIAEPKKEMLNRIDALFALYKAQCLSNEEELAFHFYTGQLYYKILDPKIRFEPNNGLDADEQRIVEELKSFIYQFEK